MSITEQLDQWVESKRDELLNALSELIKIKTLNMPPDGFEKPGQEFLYNRIIRFIPEKNIDMFEIDEVEGIREHPLFYSTINGIEKKYKNRPNLIARLNYENAGKSIVFSGHMDVMPVKEDKWKVFEDPFSGKIKDGKMYGRGTADMKAGTLACFAAIECLKDLQIKLRGNVYAESVVDEENGGVNGTLAARLRNPDIDFAILPEPSQMVSGIETRGGSDFKITIDEQSPGGMVFSQKPVNPIFKMSKVALAIDKYDRERNERTIFPEYFKHDRYLPIHTFQFVSGGCNYQESGAIPAKAHIYLWLETLAGMDEKKEIENFDNFLTKELMGQEEFKTGLLPKLEQQIRFLKGHKTDLKHAGMRSIKNAHHLLNLKYKPGPLNFACDAFAFKEVSNTEVIVIGPRGGNLHGMDEWVDVNDFFNLIKIMVLTAIDYCK